MLESYFFLLITIAVNNRLVCLYTRFSAPILQLSAGRRTTSVRHYARVRKLLVDIGFFFWDLFSLMSIIVLGTVCSAAATEVFFSLFLSFIINSINSQHGTVAIIRRVGLISQLRYRSLPMIFDHDQ